ncbi:ISAon1 family transposase N-terminal region protein [Ravibacter arvi]|uniref:ISAon1 family transposase N-terminal region protein n=1 Tax=Ravibacter arvi TaxID=2051041 RepID=UPI003CD0C384
MGKSSGVLHVYLKVRNYETSDPAKRDLESKGFLPETTIQDFPIRDKRVFLHVKRRRWLNTRTGKVEQRNWQEVSSGTRMTAEFAAFFKRDQSILIQRALGVYVEQVHG